MFCKYRGLKYELKKRKNEYIITSKEKRDGFTNYIDVLGNEHADLYMKIVNDNDVDLIYEEEIFIKYRNVFFPLFAGRINKKSVIENLYMLCTDSEELAINNTFEKKEQFLYVKYITRNEIDALKIVKTPISTFNNAGKAEEILEGPEIDSWLSELI